MTRWLGIYEMRVAGLLSGLFGFGPLHALLKFNDMKAWKFCNELRMIFIRVQMFGSLRIRIFDAKLLFYIFI